MFTIRDLIRSYLQAGVYLIDTLKAKKRALYILEHVTMLEFKVVQSDENNGTLINHNVRGETVVLPIIIDSIVYWVEFEVRYMV